MAKKKASTIKTVKTGNATGLSISRNGGDFILTWKQPSKWFTSWQKAWWSDSTIWKKWGVFGGNVYITKGSEKRTSTWGHSSYWPSTKKKLTYVGFSIQGCHANEDKTTYTASGCPEAWYYISKPPAATVTVETSESESYKTSFKWEVKNVSATSKAWCTCVYIWTILVRNDTVTSGKDQKWGTNYGGDGTYHTRYSTESSSSNGTKYEKRVWATSGTFEVTEDPSLLNDGNSYTRWVCIRAQGPAGDSADVYKKHVYAMPLEPEITKWKIKKNDATSGYTAQIWFTNPYDASRPLSNLKVQYGISAPAEGYTCPDNISWKDAVTVLHTDRTGGAIFSIDQLLSKDQCLFVRVNSVWDKKETYGTPKIIDAEDLKKPTINSISLDSATHKATIEATNNSDVPDSFMVVRFMTNDDPKGIDVAIIPHGETTAIGIQCPSWTNNPRFGLYTAAPANCYKISEGYDISLNVESSYGETDVSIDKDVFYQVVDKVPGSYGFTYKEAGDYSADHDYSNGHYSRKYLNKTEIDSEEVITGSKVSLNDKGLYNRGRHEYESGFIANMFGTYRFRYSALWHEWVLESPEYGPEYDRTAYTVDLKSFGITIPSNITPRDDDELSFVLEPINCWVYDNDYDSEKTTHQSISLIDYGITLDEEIVPVDGNNIIVDLEEVPNGVSKYKVTPKMKSDIQSQGGSIPLAPESVSLEQTSIPGTIRVNWAWSWEDADSAELSWADHEDAWESTDEPTTYTITKLHAASWNISGLEVGTRWYVRVRLIKTVGDDKSYGAYSDIRSILLSSAPVTPVLDISSGVITIDGQATASWTYSSTDGSDQSFAEISEIIDTDGSITYNKLLQVETEHEVIIDAQTMNEQFGWENNETHNLVCRVTSSSGETSDWSNQISLSIAEPISCEISQNSFETISIDYPGDDGQTVTVETISLTKMPISVTVLGAKDLGTTTVSIERESEYHVERPDETDFNGYEGETIVSYSQTGEAQIVIDNRDLLGRLDDGARYKLVAMTQDSFGQSASSEIVFEVHWEHQAMYPTVETIIDEDNAVAILKPIAPALEDDILKYTDVESFPSTGESGKVYIDESTNKVYVWDDSEYKETEDVCDIYRLSVDRPELIYEGAKFGVVYVDPYPTIGEYGGHRYVTRTVNDDYIVGDSVGGSFAWTDTRAEDGDIFETHENIINFDDEEVYLLYEVDLSSAWSKDFKETKYLGGSVQGDWNSGVSRTGSLNVTTVSELDQETIQLMRRLAVYPGVCHVRSKDGSSYSADIQVNETYEYTNGPRLNKYDLSITRVDQESLDGVLYSEWAEEESE